MELAAVARLPTVVVHDVFAAAVGVVALGPPAVVVAAGMPPCLWVLVWLMLISLPIALVTHVLEGLHPTGGGRGCSG